MKTYEIVIERTVRYTTTVEAKDIGSAIKSAQVALDDEEGGPEAWPNEIIGDAIISAIQQP